MAACDLEELLRASCACERAEEMPLLSPAT